MRSPRQLAVAALRRFLSPFVPARKRLPFSFWLQSLSGEALPELHYVDRFVAGSGVAVDAGANEGIFTYLLSRRFRHVYAFEINDEVAGAIKQYNSGNVTLCSCGLSSTSRSAKLYIPVVRNTPVTGWASLYRDNLPEAQTFIEREVQVKPLDDFNLTGVDFIKIDVEGHEIEVIKGAARTIEDSRPVMLVEVKDQHLQPLNEWFLQRKFVHCSLDALFHLQEKNVNHLYVPMEKANQIGIKIPIEP